MHADDDLLRLDDLSEESLVVALHDRFERRRTFYTSVGTILIAINPFEWQPELYTKEVMKKYRDGKSEMLPPHLYQTAQMVHDALATADGASRQTIIISGESGAGKTEATKLILTFLVDAAAPSGGDDAGCVLRERVLSANPLLEAFGNAKTQRNDNSSRFGKLVELHFGRCNGPGTREIGGARIVNYLLERTRLSNPAAGERNFHILYQLLAPASASADGHADERSADVIAALPLATPEHLRYLNATAAWTAGEVAAEARAFAATSASLAALGVAADERAQLWTLLSAVLLLGNTNFEPIAGNGGKLGSPGGGGGCGPADTAAAATLAELLGVAPAALTAALCKRKLSVRARPPFDPALSHGAHLPPCPWPRCPPASLPSATVPTCRPCFFSVGCHVSGALPECHP